MNEIIHILVDPAHWVAEVVMDGTITAIVWYAGGRFALRRHDKNMHGKHKENKR